MSLKAHKGPGKLIGNKLKPHPRSMFTTTYKKLRGSEPLAFVP